MEVSVLLNVGSLSLISKHFILSLKSLVFVVKTKIRWFQTMESNCGIRRSCYIALSLLLSSMNFCQYDKIC